MLDSLILFATVSFGWLLHTEETEVLSAWRADARNRYANLVIWLLRRDPTTRLDFQNVMDDAVNVMVLKNEYPQNLVNRISKDLIYQTYPLDTFNLNTYNLIYKAYTVESVKNFTNNELPLELVKEIVSYML